MFATIQKWGNSQGIRIPKILLDALGMRENDRVEIVQNGDMFSVKKASTLQHRSLEERLTEFYGKPIEEIERIAGDTEFDWGEPKGAEEW